MAVKKLSKSKKKSFSYIRLYLGDLKEIWELLDKNYEKIRVQVSSKYDRYEIENIGDLDDITEPIKSMDIYGYNGLMDGISICIGSEYGNWVQIDKDIEKNLGVFEKGKEILYRKQSWWGHLPSNSRLMVVYFTLILIYVFMKSPLFSIGDEALTVMARILLVSSALALLLCILHMCIPKCIISPHEKKENFFVRHKENLYFSIVKYVIMLGVGSVITILWNKFVNIPPS